MKIQKDGIEGASVVFSEDGMLVIWDEDYRGFIFLVGDKHVVLPRNKSTKLRDAMASKIGYIG